MRCVEAFFAVSRVVKANLKLTNPRVILIALSVLIWWRIRGRRQLSTFFFSNERCSFFLGGGGGSEPVRLEEKSALNFFWTVLEVEPSSGRRPRQCDPRLRHLAAASRGRDPPVWSWVFDVDALTAFVDGRSTPARTYTGVLWSSEGPYVHTLCKVSVVLHSFLPGELLFQWSMKRSIQATLTGEAFKAKPVYGESSVGSGNQTLYCEFVDAFCRVSPRARAVAISEALDEWKKVRSNLMFIPLTWGDASTSYA